MLYFIEATYFLNYPNASNCVMLKVNHWQITGVGELLVKKLTNPYQSKELDLNKTFPSLLNFIARYG